MHLSHGEVSTRRKLQKIWRDSILATAINESLLQHLLILKVLLVANIINLPNLPAVIVDVLVNITSLQHVSHSALVSTWLLLDHFLHDINILEESRALLFTPHRRVRLSDWDDQQCNKNTSFLHRDLLKIYHLFGLANIADHQGFIRVPTGGTNSRGVACCYKIHAEELFLFFMTRMKKGWSINDMVDWIFGGHYSRWSHGWPWMLRYVDNRYRNILGHQGLLRFVHQFPRFFESIENFVKKPKWHTDNNGQRWWSPGLANLPYRIFGFIDCSIYRTNVPYSGPDGDVVGAGRKPWYQSAQEAIYTGWKHLHGMKVETVRLPNGISTIFGPVSCRRADIGYTGRTVHDMSGLNEKYAALGDGVYGVNMECIRSYFNAHFTAAQITEFMRVCDAEVKGSRQSIEWGYGKTENVFAACHSADSFKLGKRNPVSTDYSVCRIFPNDFLMSHIPYRSVCDRASASLPLDDQHLQLCKWRSIKWSLYV
ncbi:MAG: hypothetical protein GWQ05_03100 [Verrucomicrobiaceae bacterium]|nr:hypothetical protein [Verrucomicrobiaceae bacterium]